MTEEFKGEKRPEQAQGKGREVTKDSSLKGFKGAVKGILGAINNGLNLIADGQARADLELVTSNEEFKAWWLNNHKDLHTNGLEAAWEKLEYYFLEETERIKMVSYIYNHPKCPTKVKEEVSRRPWDVLVRRGIKPLKSSEAFNIIPKKVWENSDCQDEMLMWLNSHYKHSIPSEVMKTLLRFKDLKDNFLLRLWVSGKNDPQVARRIVHRMPVELLANQNILNTNCKQDELASRLIFRKRLKGLKVKQPGAIYNYETDFFFSNQWDDALKSGQKRFILEVFRGGVMDYPEVFKMAWKRQRPDVNSLTQEEVKEMLAFGLLSPDRPMREALTRWLGERKANEGLEKREEDLARQSPTGIISHVQKPSTKRISQ